MAVLIAGSGLRSLFTIDTKLSEFGFSETGQWTVKWLIKNILITSFLLCRFPLQRYINVEPLLKWTLMGMALIIAWLPCLKAYPVVSVTLMCFHYFLLAIGPLASISILQRSRRIDELHDYSDALLSGPTNLLFLFAWWIYISKPIISMHQYRCYEIVLIYSSTVYQIARKENERRRAQGNQEVALAAIQHFQNE